MNSEIRKQDLDEFLESLRQQDERHAKKREKGKAVTAAESSSAGAVGDKRKLDALLSPERGEVKEAVTAPEDMAAAPASLVWSAVLRELEEDLGHTPRVKYVPHVPLMEVSASNNICVTAFEVCCLRLRRCLLCIAVARRLLRGEDQQPGRGKEGQTPVHSFVPATDE
jgi:hypothetical protein